MRRSSTGYCLDLCSQDVYWFAATADEEALAAACDMHALAPSYPASLKHFFTEGLAVPLRPTPSAGRLILAIRTLAERPSTEATAAVVSACQERLTKHSTAGLNAELDGMLGVQWSSGCPRHGPGCNHPACSLLSELFHSSPSGGPQSSTNGHGSRIGLQDVGGSMATDAATSLLNAQHAISQAVTSGRSFTGPTLGMQQLRPPASNMGGPCHECDHPCASIDFDLAFAYRTSQGMPLYVDSSMSPADAATARSLAEAFAALLSFLAGIVGPSVQSTLHLFYEPPYTPTGRPRREVFAFNVRGSLWFSLRAFMSLHGRLTSVFEPECTAFWMCTLCHELAHNLAPGHDAQHEVLMERILEHYFPALIRQHLLYAAQHQSVGGSEMHSNAYGHANPRRSQQR
jgi:hypothetical protein